MWTILLSILSPIAGFFLRYLPNIFSFIGDIIKGREEDKREERRFQLMERVETLRAKLHTEEKIIDAQLQEALLKLLTEMSSIKASMEDRSSAREYGIHLNSILSSTLKQGKELGVPRWVLSFGWLGVLIIEGWSSAIQPLIATLALGMWSAWKISLFTLAFMDTAGVASAIVATWGLEDWFFMESVLGFFLAGRVQKWGTASNVNTAIKGKVEGVS